MLCELGLRASLSGVGQKGVCRTGARQEEGSPGPVEGTQTGMPLPGSIPERGPWKQSERDVWPCPEQKRDERPAGP